jgi:hypothetical protein
MVVARRGESVEEQDVAEDIQVGGSPTPSAETPVTPGTPVAAFGAGSPASTHGSSGASRSSPSPPPGAAVEFASPLSGEPDLDNGHDGAPLRFRKLDNILGMVEIPGLAEPEFVVDEDLLLATGDDEPATFEEARGDVRWRKAMMEEMASIEENKTWALVDLPIGHHPIGLKWVYKLKRDEQGVVVNHKARIVAKGYL